MTNLFNRAAIFTDLHLGMKSNSQVHNQDCERYVDWFIQLTKERNCDIILFLGDFHHNRNSINIATMDYSLRCLEKLDATGLRTMFIPGNHDLYHKDKRTLSSIKYISKFKNIELINDQYSEGDVCFVPWLIGEEHKNMRKIKDRYVMGHFELPRFLMNAMVEMPDHGELRREDFDHIERVFTGHFHKRQTQRNIHYIGNAFPHNFADAWDNERGAVILDWGKEPEFVNWTEGPEYRVMSLAQLIDNPETYLNDRTYARVNLDISISYEEANFIKETMLTQYGARELSLIPHKQELDLNGTPIDSAFESVDQIVMGQIDSIESNNYDKKLLLEIYTGL
jgi:DNA repair exonuclease SbcCD nuclease subunit